MTDIAIFLCSKSAIAAQPWADAGVECWCVDIEHSIRKDRKEGNINFVWGDVRSWLPPRDRRIIFMGAFVPCTHSTLSGARDFKKKRGWMLTDAVQMFDSAVLACEYSRAPFFVENPPGRLNTHRRAPDYVFDPCEFAGYCPDPNKEAYTKRTALWTGGGFVFPEKKPVEPVLGSMMHTMAPSEDREEKRSLTPPRLLTGRLRRELSRGGVA